MEIYNTFRDITLGAIVGATTSATIVYVLTKIDERNDRTHLVRPRLGSRCGCVLSAIYETRLAINAAQSAIYKAMDPIVIAGAGVVGGAVGGLAVIVYKLANQIL